ncbi:MAG: hypothetical protein P4L40_14815, partial [Terracidiphilus sp.]|nr:hypothetical protein [Terracidiphilus sp.]
MLLSTHGGRREYANVDEGKADLEKLNLQVQVRELSAELELARQEGERRREREEKEAAQREREAEVASSPGSAHSPRGVVAPQFLPPQGVPHLSHANVPFVHAAAREALHTDTLGGSRRWRAGIGPAVQVKTPLAWNGYLRHTHSLRPVAVVDPAVGVVGYDDSLLKREEPTRFNRIARSLSLRPTLPPRAQSNQSLKASPRRGSMHPALRGRGETESKRAYAVTSESVPALYPPPVTTSRATEPSLQAQMYARALKPYPFQPAVTFECRPLLAVHHHGDVPQQPDTPLIGRAPFACAGEWDDGWDDAVRQYQSAEWDDGWDAVVPSPQQRQPPVQYVAPPLPPPPQLPVQYAQEVSNLRCLSYLCMYSSVLIFLFLLYL